MRNLTNDEILNRAKSVPSYTDNSELVAELARRLEVLEDQRSALLALWSWAGSVCFQYDIPQPPEYRLAKRALRTQTNERISE